MDKIQNAFYIIPETEELYDLYMSKTGHIDGVFNNESNAGFDIVFPEETLIRNGYHSFDLKVRVICLRDGKPAHFFLCARSSVTKKEINMAMINGIGIIDSSYRGNLIARVNRFAIEPYLAAKGSSMFQICTGDLVNVPIHISHPHSVVSLIYDKDSTTRGAGGFGSTDIV